MKRVSTSEKVTRRVKREGSDKLWTYSDFKSFPPAAVATTLSRLAKNGHLKRVRKGVYYSPRATRFGISVPDPTRIAEAVLRHRGVSWIPSGLPAYNALGLTTQISPILTIDVEKPIANLHTGMTQIRVRSVSKVRGLRSEERVVLDALRDIKLIPDANPGEVMAKSEDLLRSERVNFDRLATVSVNEPPRVRALLGLLGTRLGKDAKVLGRLKNTLNPTTTFKVGLGAEYPEAREWNIH